MSLLLFILYKAIFMRFEVQGTGCYHLYELTPHHTSYNSSTSLGVGSFSGYLEICGLSNPSQWTPVCGGTDWTNTEALVACNILGYSNNTTLATNGGLCSAPPSNISGGVALECSVAERSAEDCHISESPICNQWGGVICTSLEMCRESICSNSSYCHHSSSCSNCSIPQELNCICYSECNPPCMNGGRCVYNNTCHCPPLWTGEHCEQYSTETPPTLSSCNPECLNNGTCSSNGQCICPPNWTGLHCAQELCSPTRCLRERRCQYSNDHCTCLTGHTGLHCELPDSRTTEIKTENTSHNIYTTVSSNVINNEGPTEGLARLLLSVAIAGHVLLGLVIIITIAILLHLKRKTKKKTANISTRHSSLSSLPNEDQDVPNTTIPLQQIFSHIDSTDISEVQATNTTQFESKDVIEFLKNIIII